MIVMNGQISSQADAIITLTDKLADITRVLVDLQNRTNTGNGGGNNQTKSIMEHTVICNIERLTNETTGFHMWTLRLKNALDQVNPLYRRVIAMIENAPDKIMTNDQWCVQYAQSLADQTGLSIEQYNQMMNDLYVLLVDK